MDGFWERFCFDIKVGRVECSYFGFVFFWFECGYDVGSFGNYFVIMR